MYGQRVTRTLRSSPAGVRGSPYGFKSTIFYAAEATRHAAYAIAATNVATANKTTYAYATKHVNSAARFSHIAVVNAGIQVNVYAKHIREVIKIAAT